MVWPMQDYWDLSWERISYAFRSAEFRQALWDIWFARDYTRYGNWKQPQQSYELSEWPVAERMRLYIRKDIAGQIWDYGVGPTVLEGESIEDPYAASRQDLPASLQIGTLGTGPGNFDGPRDVAVAADGSIYVADTRNHRVQKFDAAGAFVLSWGSYAGGEGVIPGPGQFNEPWGIAVGPDGSVYVADTWNHRIQKFDANGGYITSWGIFGQAETAESFWGPRDVVVDSEGRVYVADTGNKRISVFDADGNSLNTIGFGGSDPGQFDEPVGMAVSDEGLLFVADTWNQRVQVFQRDPVSGEFTYLREWPIVGWYGQSLDNKPYLAVDSSGRVYVGDPEGYRVLVFDATGQFLATWGDFGTEPGRFAMVNGVAVDAAGNTFVVDSGNNRVVKFPPVTTP
jgi:DNA-binding beta-propeller fold protein YncE